MKSLFILLRSLNKIFSELKADLIIYNAGTDVLRGDPLGCLNVSVDGIIERDAKVFSYAKQNEIPIVLLTRY